MNKQQKRERVFLLVAILFAVIVVIYTSAIQSSSQSEDAVAVRQNESEEFVEYTFSKVDDEEKIWGTSKICDIYELYEQDKSPLAYGQMLTLFGEPLYTTENLENQYSYVIAATDTEGNVTYLNVYSGPSGPSIGGMPEDEEVTKKLVLYIK